MGRQTWVCSLTIESQLLGTQAWTSQVVAAVRSKTPAFNLRGPLMPGKLRSPIVGIALSMLLSEKGSFQCFYWCVRIVFILPGDLFWHSSLHEFIDDPAILGSPAACSWRQPSVSAGAQVDISSSSEAFSKNDQTVGVHDVAYRQDTVLLVKEDLKTKHAGPSIRIIGGQVGESYCVAQRFNRFGIVDLDRECLQP
jgi:hypothetical protein